MAEFGEDWQLSQFWYSDETSLALAKEIGYPVIIKAAAGGGGRGMRVVHNEAALLKAIHVTQTEAKSFFGDGTVAVFLPSVPAVTLGQVHIVPEERIEPVSASLHAALETLTMFGEGASKLIDTEPTP